MQTTSRVLNIDAHQNKPKKKSRTWSEMPHDMWITPISTDIFILYEFRKFSLFSVRAHIGSMPRGYGLPPQPHPSGHMGHSSPPFSSK